MFELFTAGARRCVVGAVDEARGARHCAVATEDLLLAVMADTTSATVLAAASLNLDADDIRRRVRALSPTGDTRDTGGYLPFDPETKAALEQALREAQGFGDRHITGGHLLIALTTVDGSLAQEVLAELGVGPEQARGAVADATAGARAPALEPATDTGPDAAHLVAWLRRLGVDVTSTTPGHLPGGDMHPADWQDAPAQITVGSPGDLERATNALWQLAAEAGSPDLGARILAMPPARPVDGEPVIPAWQYAFVRHVVITGDVVLLGLRARISAPQGDLDVLDELARTATW